jgi:opacity protein-like surface antigen
MVAQRLLFAAFAGTGLVAAGLYSAPVRAQDESRGWFVGAATDDTHLEILRGGWGYETSGSERGYSLRGGMRLNRHFDLEVGTMSAAGLNWTEYLTSYPNALVAHTTFDVRSVNLSALGKVVGDVFEGYIKVGVAKYDVDGRQVLDTLFVDAAATRDIHASDLDYLIGAGFFIKPSPKWRVRVEYQYFSVERDFLGVSSDDDPTIDSFSIGFDYLLAKRSTGESASQ